MPADPFNSSADSANHPSRAPFAILPSDTDALPMVPKAIYVGSGGSVCVRGVGGTEDVIFRNFPSGAVIDVRASHVRASGTTAADLVGLA